MNAIFMLPLLIVALVALGAVGLLVYVVVFAIANKKPGVLLWAVLAPLGLLLIVAASMMLIAFQRPEVRPVHGMHTAPYVVEVPPMTFEAAEPISTDWSDWVPSTSVVQVRRSGRLSAISWFGVALLVLLAIAVVKATRRVSASGSQSRLGSRAVWPAALLVAAAVGLLYVRSERHVVVQTVPTPITPPSTEAMWDQMTKPRIELEMPDSPRPLPLVEITPETAESLRNAVGHVEAIARHMAVVAKRLSEVATSAGEAATSDSLPAMIASARESGAEAEVVPASATAAEGPSAEFVEAMTEVVEAIAVSAGIAAPTAEQAEEAADPGEILAEAVTSTDDVSIPSAADSVEAEASDATVAETSAKPRPAWVDEPPRQVHKTWLEVVSTGEYATDEECRRAADVYLLLATHDHLMRLTGNRPFAARTRPSLIFLQDNVVADGEYIIVNGRPVDERLSRMARAGINGEYIWREIIPEDRRYYETVERSVGPMRQWYLQLAFSPSVERDLLARWDNYRRVERFAVVGVISGAVIGLVGFVYGLLKVDTWTKGYYTKRLFLGGSAAIIGLVALLALMVS